MNIYARFFDNETLVHNVEDLLSFLQGLQDFKVTPDMEEDIREYVSSDVRFPRRYKIKPRIYFILIKTSAETMEEFKSNNKNNQTEQTEITDADADLKEQKLIQLMEENIGWYRCKLGFKRVLPIPGTMKFQYKDTSIEVCLKGNSGQDCYNRIIHYLQNRSDIDMRSQYPSAKGNNFVFEYLGEEKPDIDALIAETKEIQTK